MKGSNGLSRLERTRPNARSAGGVAVLLDRAGPRGSASGASPSESTAFARTSLNAAASLARLPAHGSDFLERGGVRLVHRDAASSYGWWGNIVVVAGRRSPDATHVQNYRACVVELHERCQKGVGLITVVQADSTPSVGGREAMIQMFKELWPMLDGALFIPDAVGFRAAALRSVMGCCILAIGQRDRLKVEASIERGVPWLAAKLWGPAADSTRADALALGVSRFYERESARG